LTKPTFLQSILFLPLWLPLELWNSFFLERVGNAIGCFIALEENFNFKEDMRVAKILVEIDHREGLHVDIEVAWGNRVLNQNLDFYKIPFHCRLSYNWKSMDELYKP
jgi:hypothetical protein